MRRSSIIMVVLACLVLTAGCGARFPRETTAAGTQGEGTAAPAPGEGTVGEPLPGGTSETTAPPATAGTVTPGGAGAAARGPAAPAAQGGGGAPALEAGPAPGVSDTEIKVGYLLPLTGAAPVPASFDEGANVYWDYTRRQGGIHGRNVRAIIRDTQSRASVGKQEAQKLIEDEKVFAVVVLDRLENQQAIGDYLDARKVPNIEVQTQANLPKERTWTFGITIDHAVQGGLIADYFGKVLKAQKVAVVYENTPALVPGRDAFVRRAGALGLQVVYNKAIQGDQNDFSGEALELANRGATATWLYMAPEQAAKLSTQADAAGYHPTWFANSISWNFDLALTAAPKALAGARAFSPWVPLSDPRTDTYKQAYRQQYNREPDDLGIVGWGVGEIVAEGLRRAGRNLGQNNFRNAMQNLNFKPQVWAPLAFGPGVRQGANSVAVFREEGRRWVLDRDFTSAF